MLVVDSRHARKDHAAYRYDSCHRCKHLVKQIDACKGSTPANQSLRSTSCGANKGPRSVPGPHSTAPFCLSCICCPGRPRRSNGSAPPTSGHRAGDTMSRRGCSSADSKHLSSVRACRRRLSPVAHCACICACKNPRKHQLASCIKQCREGGNPLPAEAHELKLRFPRVHHCENCDKNRCKPARCVLSGLCGSYLLQGLAIPSGSGLFSFR